MKLFSFICMLKKFINRQPLLVLLTLFWLYPAHIQGLDQVRPDVKKSTHNKTQDIYAIRALNEIIQKTYKCLNSMTNILEYLGQALNKGSIQVSDQESVRDWIKYHITCIRTIEKQLYTPLAEVSLDAEVHLYAIIMNITRLVEHITEQLEDRLQHLVQFKEHNFQVNSISLSLSDIEILITRTEQLIDQCKTVANEAGLSKINILTRKLDALNTRYQIVPRVFAGTVMAGVGIGLIYCLPRTLFPQNWRLLHTIKDKLGDRPKTKEDKEITDEDYAKLGVLGKFEHTYQKKTTQDILSGLGILGGFALGKDLKQWYISGNSVIKNYWEKLKGFTVKDENMRYQIIEDLTLDDERIIGFEAEKEVLNQLTDYVVDPEMYDRSNSNPAKSILLEGNSGCGKTLLARAISGTTNKKMKEKGKEGKFGFVELKWSDIVYSKDGIKTAIEKLKQNAPCFGFIDELHLFPLQTNGGGYSETLAQFLTGLSGLNSESDTKHQVILIAASNRPDLLDPALLRTGRLGDTVIRCNKPNYALRQKYFEVMLKRNLIDTTRLDIPALTRQTEDCSYSDLDAIVKTARFSARTMAQGITQKHLQDKIDTLVRRIKKEIPYTEQEKKTIAAHLAGHVLLYWLPETQPVNKKLDTATIYPTAPRVKESRVWDNRKEREEYHKNKIKYGGLFTYHTNEILQSNTQADLHKLAKIKLAGALAEKLLLKTNGSAYRPMDRLNAFKIIKKIVLNGIPEENLSKSKKEEITNMAHRMLEQYEQEVAQLIKKHESLLVRIASELEHRHLLTIPDIDQIIKEHQADLKK
jgi:cell division protease FtsH